MERKESRRPSGKKRAGQKTRECGACGQEVLMLASVASMIDQFNMPNIRLLQEMGYRVHVACNFKEGNTCNRKRVKELQKTLRGMGVAWHQWDCPRNIHHAAECYKAYRQLLRLMDRYSFAWLHCHSPIGGALARLAAHKRGVWVIYTAHGFHFYQGAPLKNWLLYYPVEKLLAHWTDVLITVNREDYQFAKRHLKAGKIYHIPGVGIDIQRFQKQQPDAVMPQQEAHGAADETGKTAVDTDFAVPQQEAHGTADESVRQGRERKRFCRKYRIPMDAFVLLSVGELNEGKNHRMVIDALAAMKRQDVYYLICGQGALRRELRRHAQRMGVGGRVRLPGYQEDMPWIYWNADVFVFPSMREGMPVALMEAMAAGLPCVVSDIRGNRELIGRDADGSLAQECGGICFSLKEPEQLPAALERLLEDERAGWAYGMYNQKKMKGYDQAAVLRKMRRIYESF